jgi:hypothetical protein
VERIEPDKLGARSGLFLSCPATSGTLLSLPFQPTIDSWIAAPVLRPGNALTKSRKFLEDGVSGGSPHEGV